MRFCLLGLAGILACGCGVVYTPGHATGQARIIKMGEAKCIDVLYFFSFGNCTIAQAARNGRITNVSTVDFANTGIKYIYTTRTTIVTGE